MATKGAKCDSEWTRLEGYGITGESMDKIAIGAFRSLDIGRSMVPLVRGLSSLNNDLPFLDEAFFVLDSYGVVVDLCGRKSLDIEG